MIYKLAPSTMSGLFYILTRHWGIYFELKNYLEENKSVENIHTNFRQYLGLLKC